MTTIHGYTQDEIHQIPPEQAVNVYRIEHNGTAIYYCTSTAGAWQTDDDDDGEEYGFEPVDEEGNPLLPTKKAALEAASIS